MCEQLRPLVPRGSRTSRRHDRACPPHGSVLDTRDRDESARLRLTGSATPDSDRSREPNVELAPEVQRRSGGAKDLWRRSQQQRHGDEKSADRPRARVRNGGSLAIDRLTAVRRKKMDVWSLPGLSWSLRGLDRLTAVRRKKMDVWSLV